MPIRHASPPIYLGVFPQLRRRKVPRYLPLTEEEKKVLLRLDPSHQVVLRLTGSMKDAAARLNIPIGTLKGRLRCARKALADVLSRDAKQGLGDVAAAEMRGPTGRVHGNFTRNP